MTATPTALALVAGAFGPRAAGILAPAREVLFGLLIVLFDVRDAYLGTGNRGTPGSP